MEQDRAPPFLVHHHELESSAARQLSVIVDLISATTTKTGLAVRCELDDKPYPKGTIVSDEVMRNLNIQPAEFHGEWNYTIAPSTPHIKAVDS
jgi:hypothetical protein